MLSFWQNGKISFSRLFVLPKRQLKKDIFLSSFRHLFALSKRYLKKTTFSYLLVFFCAAWDVSHTIINWLTHAMKLHYDLFHFFFNVICCLFCRLCHSYCRSLLFILSFVAVRIAVFCCFLIFIILSVYHFFCHPSISVLCLPIPINWIVANNKTSVFKYRSL